jgi:hypothetical protein
VAGNQSEARRFPMLRSQETSQEASLQKLGQARKFEGWILSSAMARKTIDYSDFESGRSVHFLRAPKLVDSSVHSVSLQHVVCQLKGVDCANFNGDFSRNIMCPNYMNWAPVSSGTVAR